MYDDFYPRPPRGGRLREERLRANLSQISIHALREEGDYEANLRAKGPELFLSTPSARRATGRHRPGRHHRQISIHALREEGDQFHRGREGRQRISIHALREEGDIAAAIVEPALVPFLSTPSARRATNCNNFAVASSKISIHALREEGDSASGSSRLRGENFYPRPPRGGRPSTTGKEDTPQ